MINGINAIGKTYYVTKPSFKAEEKAPEIAENLEEFNSADLVSSYNKAELLLGKKFEVEPLLPTIFHPNYTNAIKGERIYTSDGKLYSIVDENETTKTVYIPNEEDTRFFDSIITTDKESGNVIRKQINTVEDGKYLEMYIAQYSPQTGNILAHSTYNNGELNETSKYIYKDNGAQEVITYVPSRKMYYCDKASADGNTLENLSVSSNLKFGTIDLSRRIKGKEISYNANFYNGGLISFSETKQVVMPNLIGREPLADKDLQPAEKLDLEGLSPDIKEGEKTYYSNGAVESIIFPFGTIHYTPEGKINKLVSDKREVEVLDNGNQIIKENLGDNESRTTSYFQDDSVEIRYQNEESYKILSLNKNKSPMSYEEGMIDTEKHDNNSLSLYYNKGVLESAYGF